MTRPFVRAALVLLILLLLALAIGYANAVRDPIVRRGSVTVRGWPADKPPVRVVLISDVHVAGPDMPPARLARIVEQMNALRPDLVLIAGDLVSDKAARTRSYSFAEALAPLRRLRAPALAVLGNHDHWRDGPAARAALRGAGVDLIENRIVRRAGLTVAGIDDIYAGRPDTTLFDRPLPGPVLLLTHSPEVVRLLPRGERLVLAGHTHCGQIVLPVIGPLGSLQNGKRGPLACGVVRRKGRVFVVSAGLGTSILPLRFGAPPDLWLLSFRPAAPVSARAGALPPKR